MANFNPLSCNIGGSTTALNALKDDLKSKIDGGLSALKGSIINLKTAAAGLLPAKSTNSSFAAELQVAIAQGPEALVALKLKWGSIVTGFDNIIANLNAFDICDPLNADILSTKAKVDPATGLLVQVPQANASVIPDKSAADPLKSGKAPTVGSPYVSTLAQIRDLKYSQANTYLGIILKAQDEFKALHGRPFFETAVALEARQKLLIALQSNPIASGYEKAILEKGPLTLEMIEYQKELSNFLINHYLDNLKKDLYTKYTQILDKFVVDNFRDILRSGGLSNSDKVFDTYFFIDPSDTLAIGDILPSPWSPAEFPITPEIQSQMNSGLETLTRDFKSKIWSQREARAKFMIARGEIT